MGHLTPVQSPLRDAWNTVLNDAHFCVCLIVQLHTLPLWHAILDTGNALSLLHPL